MTSLFERLSGHKAKSADQAKERLKLVLIHDRTHLTQEELANLQDELLKVISRYVEIDPEAVHISMTQDGREQRLVADIPVKSARRKRMG